MTWHFRPGMPSDEQLKELERAVSLANLTDVQIDEANLLLYIFTETHKYSVPLTLVS